MFSAPVPDIKNLKARITTTLLLQ